MTMKKRNYNEIKLENFYQSEKRHLREKVLLLQALEKEFGIGVRIITREERARSVRSKWEEVAKHAAGVSIKDLIETLWEPLQQKGIVQYKIISLEDERTCLEVKSCLFAKIVEELNIPNTWGYDLYCSDDEHIVKGFNQNIEFSRSKTLMENYDCCNHCYRMKF